MSSPRGTGNLAEFYHHALYLLK